MKEFNVALYARISSEQKANAGTIESQLAVLRERIKQDGYPLSPDLTFVDQGYSGAILIRPALERLRDAVALQTIARLYVLSPDRLARNYAYQVLLIDEFQRAGVEVVFLNRDVAQTPEDQLLLQMQGMIAEYERAKILERSRRGKRHAAQTGQVAVLSGAPYGFRYVSKHDGGGQARYEVIEREVDAVQQMFVWVGVERVSIGEVCRRLKKAGIPSSKGKAAWDRATVRGLLKNPAYKGLAAFGKTREGPMRPRLRAQRGHLLQPRRATSTTDQRPEDWTLIPVPPIVDAALFEAVQTQLEENRRRARQGQRGARYLLQGLLVCAHCGYALYGKAISLKAGKGHRRDYAYYRCIGSDAFRFGGERICDNLQVRTDLLDETVWNEVCGLLQDPQRLQQEYERRLKDPGPEAGKQVALETQMKKLEQGISRLIDSYAEGVIQKSEFEPRVARLKQRRAELEKQAQDIQDQVTLQAEFQLAISRLEEFGEKVNAGLKEADWPMRRELIRTLVKRVEVGKEAVKIVFRIPPDSGGLRSNATILHYWGRSSDAALGRAFSSLLKETFFHVTCLEKRLYEVQQPPIPDTAFDEVQQDVMLHMVETARDVALYSPIELLTIIHQPVAHRYAVHSPSPRSEATGAVQEIAFPDWFHKHLQEHLYYPVTDGRHTHSTLPLYPLPPSGFVTIIRPDHPLYGQQVKVIRIRRGPDPDLIVQLEDGTHAAVAMSGTDYATSPEQSPALVAPHLLALDGLHQAVLLIEHIRQEGRFPEMAP